MAKRKTVRAAGGILVRTRAGVEQVLVIHRPGYDDWSLPKGKAAAGETDHDTAVREVEEETGLRCRIISDLIISHYIDRKGRDKTVRWFRMEIEEDLGFEANEEVDERRWIPIADARSVLSYERERIVLAALERVESR